ncbi:MAG TPA: (Na+)-NQR maturation NqrM [Pseudomonadales bacterium]|nr:(Na+)-NQR maturation NqrM [Pseudomonadales bacterium]
MQTIILVFIIMGLAILAMAVGVIFKRKPISGTCGGLNAIGLKGECEICGGNAEKCEENSSRKP